MYFTISDCANKPTAGNTGVAIQPCGALLALVLAINRNEWIYITFGRFRFIKE